MMTEQLKVYSGLSLKKRMSMAFLAIGPASLFLSGAANAQNLEAQLHSIPFPSQMPPLSPPAPLSPPMAPPAPPMPQYPSRLPDLRLPYPSAVSPSPAGVQPIPPGTQPPPGTLAAICKRGDGTPICALWIDESRATDLACGCALPGEGLILGMIHYIGWVNPPNFDQSRPSLSAPSKSLPPFDKTVSDKCFLGTGDCNNYGLSSGLRGRPRIRGRVCRCLLFECQPRSQRPASPCHP
jgi:hypothetical protein